MRVTPGSAGRAGRRGGGCYIGTHAVAPCPASPGSFLLFIYFLTFFSPTWHRCSYRSITACILLYFVSP